MLFASLHIAQQLEQVRIQPSARRLQNVKCLQRLVVFDILLCITYCSCQGHRANAAGKSFVQVAPSGKYQYELHWLPSTFVGAATTCQSRGGSQGLLAPLASEEDIATVQELILASCLLNKDWIDAYFLIGLTSLGHPQLLAFLDRPRFSSSTSLIRTSAVLGTGAVDGRWPDVANSGVANGTGSDEADTAAGASSASPPLTSDATLPTAPLCTTVRVLWEPSQPPASSPPPAPPPPPLLPPPAVGVTTASPPSPRSAATQRIAACSSAATKGAAAAAFANFNVSRGSSSSTSGTSGRFLLELNFESCDGKQVVGPAASGAASQGSDMNGANETLHAFVCRVPADPSPPPSPPPIPAPPAPGSSPPLPTPQPPPLATASPPPPESGPEPPRSLRVPASAAPPDPPGPSPASPVPPRSPSATRASSLFADGFASPESSPPRMDAQHRILQEEQQQQAATIPPSTLPPAVQGQTPPPTSPADLQTPARSPPSPSAVPPPPSGSAGGQRSPPPQPAPRPPPAGSPTRNLLFPPPVSPSPPAPPPIPPSPPPTLTLSSVAIRCQEAVAGGVRYKACHTPVSWVEAVQICSQLVSGGTLAVFESQDHYDTVSKLLTEGGLVGSYDYWFGLVSGANVTGTLGPPPLEYILTDPRASPAYMSWLWKNGQLGVHGSCADVNQDRGYGMMPSAEAPPSPSPPSPGPSPPQPPAPPTRPTPPPDPPPPPVAPMTSSDPRPPSGVPSRTLLAALQLPLQPTPQPPAAADPAASGSDPAQFQPPTRMARRRSNQATQIGARPGSRSDGSPAGWATDAASTGEALNRRSAQASSGFLPRASGCCGSITATTGAALPPPRPPSSPPPPAGANATSAAATPATNRTGNATANSSTSASTPSRSNTTVGNTTAIGSTGGTANSPTNASNTTASANGTVPSPSSTTNATTATATTTTTTISAASGSAATGQAILLRQCQDRLYFICQAPVGAPSTVSSPSPAPPLPPSAGEAPGVPATTLVASLFLDAMATSYRGAYRVFRAAVLVSLWGVTPDVAASGNNGILGQLFINESVTEISRSTLLPVSCFRPSLQPSPSPIVLDLTLNLRGLPRATLSNLSDFLTAAMVARRTKELLGDVYLSSWRVQVVTVQISSIEDLTDPPPPSPPAPESASSSNNNVLIIVTSVAGGVFVIGAVAAFLLYRYWQRRSVATFYPGGSPGEYGSPGESRFRFRGLRGYAGAGGGGGSVGVGSTNMLYVGPEVSAKAVVQDPVGPTPFLKPQLSSPLSGATIVPSPSFGRMSGRWTSAAQLGSSAPPTPGDPDSGRTPSQVYGSHRVSGAGYSVSGRLALTGSAGGAAGAGAGGSAVALTPLRSGGSGGAMGAGGGALPPDMLGSPFSAIVANGAGGAGGGAGTGAGAVRPGSGRLRPSPLDVSGLGFGGLGEGNPASPPYSVRSPSYGRMRTPSYADRVSTSGSIAFGLAGPQMAPDASFLPPPPPGVAPPTLSAASRGPLRRPAD